MDRLWKKFVFAMLYLGIISSVVYGILYVEFVVLDDSDYMAMLQDAHWCWVLKFCN